MAITISVFNNKGGVGKTTYLYHIGHSLAKKGIKVLMVDCDSQCNLTAYALKEHDIVKNWKESGRSIYRVIEPIEQGIGDFRQRSPEKINENLWIVPGDLNLSNYEDRLGDSWNRAKGGSAPDLRIQSAIYRYIKWACEKIDVDIVLIDLGPNLGALNRTILGGSDYFLVPISPDLFSIKGTENLGNKLVLWNREWQQCNNSNELQIDIPNGTPTFIGYVLQQHNVRNNNSGMTRGWGMFGNQVEGAVQDNIVQKLLPLGQIYEENNSYNLGKIPNLHSLVPYSLNARKPVFDCGSKDGLTGAHITKARESEAYYSSIVNKLIEILNDQLQPNQ